MKHIQRLIDMGWILHVQKSAPDYVAHVDNPYVALNVVSGHATRGSTAVEAIFSLETYVASQYPAQGE